MPEDVGEYFPAAETNRNLAIYDNLILDNGADGYAYALNARTGELVWETHILDYRTGAKNSSGPIIANGKVISGRSCEPEGGPEACVITAFDAKTGRELWRTRHDSEARRARRRNLGRHSLREALARRHVDGAELRSGAEPHLRRHVGHRSRAEVHARRQRTSSTSITTRRSRSTATPARSSGTSSTSSITGISIIRSSGCSSTPSSRRIRRR